MGADVEVDAGPDDAAVTCPGCGRTDWPIVGSPAPVCPYCGGELAALSRRCPHCQGDLLPLRRTIDMADRYFNLALAAAGQHEPDWRAAGEHLAVTLALCPHDVEALVLLGKVRCGQGDPRAAVRLWDEALRVDPVGVEVHEAVAGLLEKTKPRPPVPHRGAPSSGRKKPGQRRR